MMNGPLLALTDVDVRAPDAVDSQQGDVEFATFCEGAYVESVFLSRARALEIHTQLGAILGVPVLSVVVSERADRYKDIRCVNPALLPAAILAYLDIEAGR
jgi:hypothetical protein